MQSLSGLRYKVSHIVPWPHGEQQQVILTGVEGVSPGGPPSNTESFGICKPVCVSPQAPPWCWVRFEFLARDLSISLSQPGPETFL